MFNKFKNLTPFLKRQWRLYIMNSFKRSFALIILCLNLVLVSTAYSDSSSGVTSAQSANSSLFQKLKSYFQSQIGSVNLEQTNTATDTTIPSTTNPATTVITDATHIPSTPPRWTPTSPFGDGTFQLNPDAIREILTGGRTVPGGIITRFHEGEGAVHTEISAADANSSHPAIAYDPDHRRYLVVWDQEGPSGAKNIYGQLIPVEGAPIGSPQLLSAPRTTQGCFYQSFADNVHATDSYWSRVSIPGLDRCNVAQNPSVAFNNGHFLVTWELASSTSSAANVRFSGIIAKLIDANDMNLRAVSTPDGNWDEGILISGSPGIRVEWEAERALLPATPGMTFIPDSAVYWALHTRPRVAPKADGDGFLVAWETNQDFNYCEADRRASSSIYARAIPSNFSRAGGSGNPAIFAVYSDPTNLANSATYQMNRSRYIADVRAGRRPAFPAPSCASLAMVTKASKPDLAFNQMNHKFLVAFEAAAAAGAGTGNIAAKLVAIPAMGAAQVFGEGLPLMAQAAMGQIYHNPSVASFGDTIQLAYDNGMDIFVKSIRVMDMGMIPMPSVSEAQSLSAILSNPALRTNPTLSANVGISGMAPAGMRPVPDRLVVAWRDGSSGAALNATVLDSNLRPARSPAVISVSPRSVTSNSFPAAASDLEDFYVTWIGASTGSARVLGAWVNSQDGLARPEMLSPNTATPLPATTTSVPLTWGAVTGATGYEVFVATGSEAFPAMGRMTTMPRLDYAVTMNTSYRWKVRATDGRSRRSESEVASFGVGIAPLNAPTNLMPNTMTPLPATTTSIPLTWDAVTGASSYEVFVAVGSGAFPTMGRAVTTPRLDYTGVAAGMTYRWYVVARAGSRMSAPSITASFGIGVAPLGVPVGLTPCGSMLPMGSGNSATLAWSPVTGTGLTYDVLMDMGAGTTAPTTVLMASIPQSTMPSYTTMGLMPSTTYRWMVRVREGTARSQDSAVCTFTTAMPDNRPPTAPALAAQPADNVTWAPTRLYLSWAASTDPDGDAITYSVYFINGTTIPVDSRGVPTITPYKSGLTFSGADTPKFIIQASTDARPAYTPDSGVTPIYLSPMQNYAWKICARDSRGGQACSDTRRFNTDNSVVGWWRFDENPVGMMACPSMPGVGGPAGDPGETVCDYSGFGNHGVARGFSSTSWIPPMTGILGGALQFDGRDDDIVIANSSGSLQEFSTLTLSCRIIDMMSDAYTSILSKDRTGVEGPFAFGSNPGESVVFGVRSPTSWYAVTANNPAGAFRVSGTYDRTTIKIFTGGVLRANMAVSGAIVSNANPIDIGYQDLRRTHFRGSIQECVVGNRALSEIEVENLSNSD